MINAIKQLEEKVGPLTASEKCLVEKAFSVQCANVLDEALDIFSNAFISSFSQNFRHGSEENRRIADLFKASISDAKKKAGL